MHPFISKINQTILNHSLLAENDQVLVGFSGGPDSRVLLEAFLLLKEKYNLKQVAAAHVNYGTRPGAQGDENFCRRICERGRIELNVLDATTAPLPAHIKQKKNFEERAREIRYWFFERLAEEKGFTKLAVGHNLNDQAETVLANFLRGSGLNGIGGMAYYRRGFLIRPLLDANREEILDFLKEKKLDFRQDETNNDARFTRNRIRHELLTKIQQEYNPNILRTLGRNAALYREASREMQRLGREAIQSALIQRKKQETVIDWPKISTCLRIVQAEALRLLIQETRGDLKNISENLIDKTLRFLNDPQKKGCSREITKLTICKKGDKVFLSR